MHRPVVKNRDFSPLLDSLIPKCGPNLAELTIATRTVVPPHLHRYYPWALSQVSSFRLNCIKVYPLKFYEETLSSIAVMSPEICEIPTRTPPVVESPNDTYKEVSIQHQEPNDDGALQVNDQDCTLQSSDRDCTLEVDLRAHDTHKQAINQTDDRAQQPLADIERNTRSENETPGKSGPRRCLGMRVRSWLWLCLIPVAILLIVIIVPAVVVDTSTRHH